MNTNIQKPKEVIHTIFSPIKTYLIESSLFLALPKDVFNWEFISTDGTILSRLMSWNEDDLLGGKLDILCEKLLSEKIKPVVIVQANSNNDAWFEKFTDFVDKFQYAVETRLLIDEYDEYFEVLCQELYFPERKFVNALSSNRICNNMGLTVWLDRPEIKSDFFVKYGITLKTWLLDFSHQMELQNEFDEDIMEDPGRDMDSDEFLIEQIGNTIQLTCIALPFIKIEGKIENGIVTECSSTGFFSPEFAKSLLLKFEKEITINI